MVSPLIQSQPPEIRNTARFCSSSIFPTRPIGFKAMVRAPASSPGLMRLLMPSVGISPGAMVLSGAAAAVVGCFLSSAPLGVFFAGGQIGFEPDAVAAPFRRQRHGHGMNC